MMTRETLEDIRNTRIKVDVTFAEFMQWVDTVKSNANAHQIGILWEMWQWLKEKGKGEK